MSIADDWGLWPAVAILVLGALALFWALRPFPEDETDEETEQDRFHRRFEQ